MIFKEIEIGGKLRGLVFSQGTNMLARQQAKDYTDDERIAFGGYCILWAALKANCIVKKIECDFTFEDVINWADKLSIETYTDLITANNEMNEFQADVNQPELSDEEKKSKTETIVPIVTDLPVS